jgi:DNA-binding beta-propeller fold protein YncE
LTRPGHTRGGAAAALAVSAAALSGCALFSAPVPPVVHGPSLSPAGAVGYVVCPNAVTPVELATHTAEPGIRLPLTGTPDLGNFAITTSPDGRWAYVDTSDGVTPSPSTSHTTLPPVTTATTATTRPTATTGPNGTTTGTAAPSGVRVQNVVIPINLATQQAGKPILIPGQGGTHAIVVMPGGRTVLAASGSTIVPVDAVTRRVGSALDLGPGHTIFGMALDPAGPTLYALVAGGVFPVDTANATAGDLIPTQLSVSSVYSPHGIAVTANGATVYVVGQGGTDYGGRVLPIVTATGSALPMTGFDQFGISDPAAIAVDPTGTRLLVADSANNWVNPVSLATFANPAQPVPLPARAGTGHPTDIVYGPGNTGAFVVDGFNAVIPYQSASQTFGRPIGVCSGASSMAVAPAP